MQLDYITPVLGEPWSIPFEFPFFQFICSLIQKISNIDIVIIGRLLSYFFFLSSLGLIIKIGTLLKLTRQAYSCAVIIMYSPFYLFWASSFMIESTALFFSLLFLYSGIKIYQNNPCIHYYFLYFISLSIAFLQKITVSLSFIILFFMFVLLSQKITTLHREKKNYIIFLLTIVASLIFIFWTNYTDLQKASHPIAHGLTSYGLSLWNYGDTSLLKDFNYWNWVFFTRLFNGSFILFLIFVLTFSHQILFSKNKLLTFSCIFLIFFPPLIFRNLYVVHDYYYFSNYLFLYIPIINCIYEITRNPHNRVIALLFLVFFIISFGFSGEKYISAKFSTKKLSSYENDTQYKVGQFLKNKIKNDGPIVVYGMDWSSVIAFYSEKKALMVPKWDNLEHDVFNNLPKYLSNKPSAAIFCGASNYYDTFLTRFESELNLKNYYVIDKCKIIY